MLANLIVFDPESQDQNGEAVQPTGLSIATQRVHEVEGVRIYI